MNESEVNAATTNPSPAMMRASASIENDFKIVPVDTKGGDIARTRRTGFVMTRYWKNRLCSMASLILAFSFALFPFLKSVRHSLLLLAIQLVILFFITRWTVENLAAIRKRASTLNLPCERDGGLSSSYRAAEPALRGVTPPGAVNRI